MDLAVDRHTDVPLGSQLVWQIQALIVDGRLQPGERLPSVRGLAESVGVNVNTVRAVYERLEGEGFVRSEHGRGTFVAENVPQARPEALRLYGRPAGGSPPEGESRGELREQIAALEARLVRHVEPVPVGTGRGGSSLLTTEELREVRNQLAGRLQQLDDMRDDLVDILASLRVAIGEEAPQAEPAGPAPARPRIRPKPRSAASG